MAIWNPWHGCHKFSAGCKNCYVYRKDEKLGRDASVVFKTGDYDLPVGKNRRGEYKLTAKEGTVFCCMTSDFFIEEADAWRAGCFSMMRERSDLSFVIITKRIHRFLDCIPDDWGEGYPNVAVYCTVENKEEALRRLPLYIKLPIVSRHICIEPMLGPVDVEPYIKNGEIDCVLCGGESGDSARVCAYDWVLSVREQCVKYDVSFSFHQTGAVFLKDGKTYHVDRKYHHSQAKKAGIDFAGRKDRENLRAMPKTERPSDKEWQSLDLFERIQASSFRSRFKLTKEEKTYVSEKGMDVIRSHAADFVRERLSPAHIPNDGKQTPMRGHPVFKAQHACAICCRECLYKWHGIAAGRELTLIEQAYLTDILMEWIRRQMDE